MCIYICVCVCVCVCVTSQGECTTHTRTGGQPLYSKMHILELNFLFFKSFERDWTCVMFDSGGHWSPLPAQVSTRTSGWNFKTRTILPVYQGQAKFALGSALNTELWAVVVRLAFDANYFHQPWRVRANTLELKAFKSAHDPLKKQHKDSRCIK